MTRGVTVADSGLSWNLPNSFEFLLRTFPPSHKAGNDRLFRVVLSQDTVGGRPTRIFYCTDLKQSPQEILSIFSKRWSIEATYYGCKQHLGLEHPGNRMPLAVERTTMMSMSMFLSSLKVLWFATEGHLHLKFPQRHWCFCKLRPSFADVLTTLRRKSWEDKLSKVSLSATPEDNLAKPHVFLAILA